MKIILGISHFQACGRCGEHGKLICSQSGNSYTVFSKEMARELLRQERQEHPSLPVDEYAFVWGQIYDSDMPEVIDREMEQSLIEEKECLQDPIHSLASLIFSSNPQQEYMGLARRPPDLRTN